VSFDRKRGTHVIKRRKFTEEQIAYALKQVEVGYTVEEVCRTMGDGASTFYLWKKKHQNLRPSEVRRCHHIDEENCKLMHIVADLSLDKATLHFCGVSAETYS
jgi:putative transposase